jgi:hypothetical protein
VYDAKANKLTQVLTEDARHLGGTQPFSTNAPVILIFVADLSKLGSATDEAKRNTANINVGYISQNAYLYCASEGLVTGARGSVERKALGAKLNLRPEQFIVLAQSVGYAKP